MLLVIYPVDSVIHLSNNLRLINTRTDLSSSWYPWAKRCETGPICKTRNKILIIMNSFLGKTLPLCNPAWLIFNSELVTSEHFFVVPKQHMAVCDFPYVKETPWKSQNSRTDKNLFFKPALLILTVSTNAFHSTSLFWCFSRYHSPTNSVAPTFCI